MSIRCSRGLTLIELVVFIVIVSVGIAGVLSSLNVSVMHSADPLQPKQALAVAEATLEATLLNNYADIVNTSATPLTGYTATVTVTDVTLNGASAKRVAVSVTTPGSGSYSLVGYRAQY